MQLCGERKSAPCSCAAAGWATSGGRRPGEITGIGATRRRSFFVQGKESKRRRTGGTSSRRRRGIARKGKPFWREDSRDFPDPGRNLRFLHLPLFSQYHAAVSARPRVPREHCAFLCATAPLWAGVTLGGFAPYNPYQGTEFPGPSTFFSKPCRRVGSSARSARTLRVSLRGCAAMGWGYVRGLCPL